MAWGHACAGALPAAPQLRSTVLLAELLVARTRLSTAPQVSSGAAQAISSIIAGFRVEYQLASKLQQLSCCSACQVMLACLPAAGLCVVAGKWHLV